MIHKSIKSDRPLVIDTLVLGMSKDPMLRWYFPKSHEYLANAPTLINLIGGKAFDNHTAFHTDIYACCALWLPPNIHPDADGIREHLEANVDPSRLKEVLAIEELMDKLLPDKPCWHLAIIAADPAQTGNGHGTMLLEHTVRTCDEDNQSVYLESTNSANLSLYQRYGFNLTERIQTGSSPILYSMMRRRK